MVCLFEELLSGNEKEWSEETHYNVDKPPQHFAEWRKPGKKDQTFHVYEMSRKGNPREAKIRVMFA